MDIYLCYEPRFLIRILVQAVYPSMLKFHAKTCSVTDIIAHRPSQCGKKTELVDEDHAPIPRPDGGGKNIQQHRLRRYPACSKNFCYQPIHTFALPHYRRHQKRNHHGHHKAAQCWEATGTSLHSHPSSPSPKWANRQETASLQRRLGCLGIKGKGA